MSIWAGVGGYGEKRGTLSRRRGRFGLSYRMVIASGALALLTVLAFALLYGTIAKLSAASRMAGHSAALLTSVNRLERLVVDMETGQRGYALTGAEQYLQPWQAALAKYPGEREQLRRTGAEADPRTRAQISAMVEAADAYVWEYSVPLVARERRDPAAGRDPRTLAQGKQRIDALRHRFGAYTGKAQTRTRDDRANAVHAAHRALLTAAGATLAALLLIVAFIAYLDKAIVRPLRRAAAMAEGLARGDMRARMPETSPAEIGVLEHTFNAMAGSLEATHHDLRRAVSEQAALRRVAMLVARGAPLTEIFDMAGRELGRILDADLVLIDRVEPDRTRTVMGGWHRAGTCAPRPGERLPRADNGPEASVLATGRTVRWPVTAGPAETRPDGVSGIAAPVVAGGDLWGTMSCRSVGPRTWCPDAEERLTELAGLVGTAIANDEGRAALVGARARLVAASDETRRRIERDLHDGVQQRLVSLGLELRSAEAAVPPERSALGERIAAVGRGLLDVLEDLREISRGLHPMILSRAGLEPALRALARRSAIPVELEVRTRRLEEGVEATVYYVVAETVTNAIKHARASRVHVIVCPDGDAIRVSVRDDGVGGAVLGGGSGLIGLKDRAEALGGTLRIDSPPDGGTRVTARIPGPWSVTGGSTPEGPPGIAPAAR